MSPRPFVVIVGIVTATQPIQLDLVRINPLGHVGSVWDEPSRPERGIDDNGDEQWEGVETIEVSFRGGELAKISFREFNQAVYRPNLSSSVSQVP